VSLNNDQINFNDACRTYKKIYTSDSGERGISMDEEKNYSRVNKYDKRRKTTKSITILMAIAVLLVILLIGIWLFGGKDDKDNDKPEQTQPSSSEIEEDSNENSDQSSNDSSASTEDEDEDTEDETEDAEEDEEESEDDDSIEIEEIPEDEIDDPNVIEAYTANWKPIGTSQEEPHTTKFDEGSEDWNEMQEAIAYALKIEEEEIISHWIGNGGDQRVNGHVQSTVTDEHYTVYLEWKENEGWQPIKVERVEKFIHPNQAE